MLDFDESEERVEGIDADEFNELLHRKIVIQKTVIYITPQFKLYKFTDDRGVTRYFKQQKGYENG